MAFNNEQMNLGRLNMYLSVKATMAIEILSYLSKNIYDNKHHHRSYLLNEKCPFELENIIDGSE